MERRRRGVVPLRQRKIVVRLFSTIACWEGLGIARLAALSVRSERFTAAYCAPAGTGSAPRAIATVVELWSVGSWKEEPRVRPPTTAPMHPKKIRARLAGAKLWFSMSVSQGLPASWPALMAEKRCETAEGSRGQLAPGARGGKGTML